MNRILKNTLCLCLGFVSAAVAFVSCDTMGDESYLGTVTVTLTAPESMDNFDFTAISVTAVNTSDKVSSTVKADEAGKAVISGLTAGSYNITASGKIDQIAINGVRNSVLVKSKENTDVEIELLVAGSASGLVIKEVFYSGHSYLYDAGMVAMYKDCFVELFNNSDEPISLDGLYIANLWSYAKRETGDNPEYSMVTDPSLDKDYVYADIVVRIPGSGSDYVLEPGKSFLVAQNAIDFNKELREAIEDPDCWFAESVTEEGLAHVIDLSKADMETYAVTWMQGKGRDGNEMFDLDNPNVPNVENVYYEDSKDFFQIDVNGASVVIARLEKALSDEDLYTYRYTVGGTSNEKILMKIPVASVLDGVDNTGNLESGKWKCLPNSIDLGFGYIPDDIGGATNFSMHRVIDKERTSAAGRLVLSDTNNTTNDFEAIDPPAPKGGYAGYEL